MIQDKFNPLKFWYIRRTNCRHYQLSQGITTLQGVLIRKYSFRRESLYRISECVWQDKEGIRKLFR